MKESNNEGWSKNSSIHQDRIKALEYELKALRLAELSHRALLEQSPVGIVVAGDNPLQLVYVNPAMAELTGRTTEELLSSDTGGENRLGSRAGQGRIPSVVSKLLARVGKPPSL